MKVTLIIPPPSSQFEKHWCGHVSLGIGYLSAALLAKGIDVSVIDGKLENLSLEEINERVLSFGPNLVGITSMTIDFQMAKEISYRLKNNSDISIVLGGAHSNAVGGASLAECSAFDYCCVGEGEGLILDLIACIEGAGSLDEVKGLVYRRSGEIISNPVRPYCGNYDVLSFPAWHLFPSVSILPLLTQRGCPFNCIFCSRNSGNTVRYRSVSNVLSELLYIDKHYQPKQVRFEDETFGYDLERSKEILRKIIDNKLHQRISFSAQTRVDRIDEEFMLLLRAANFIILELGVESGSDSVLQRIRKGIKIVQIKRAVELARSAGLKVWCKFILGHPHETVQEMQETVYLISSLNPDQLSVSIMTPYPGTPIYEMATSGKGGYRLLSTEWKLFDKYMGAALELEAVSLARMKWIQIWCYLRLYLVNGRFFDLLRILFQQRLMVLNLASSLFRQVFSGLLNMSK